MKINNKYMMYGGLLFAAFFFIMLFSLCSPLYGTNTWADANAFLTMGNGMKHGLVPYRDLFEQKGPLLYMMHAVNAWLTPNQFWTIAVFESLALGVSLIYIYKIAKMYVHEYGALLVAMFYPPLLLSWNMFQTGDSAEEFILPFIFISLFIMLQRFNDNFTFTKKEFTLFGVCIAIGFWIKYTLIGFWIGFYIGGIIYTIVKKDWQLFRSALLFTLLGFVGASLPIILYFVVNGALWELIDVYFIVNMTSYPVSTVNSFFITNIFGKLIAVISIYISRFFVYIPQGIFIVLGLYGVLFTNIFLKDKLQKTWFFCTFFFTFFSAYYGLTFYTYYFLITMPFVIFGLIFAVKLMSVIFTSRKLLLPKIPLSICYIALLCLAYMATTLTNHTSGGIKAWEPHQKSVKVDFAETMHARKENPTMLHYGSLDHGFYNAADILPNVRYFEYQNIAYNVYPNIVDGQNEAIAQKQVDFVVVVAGGFDTNVDYPLLEANYQLIKEEGIFKLYQQR